MSICKFGGEKR